MFKTIKLYKGNFVFGILAGFIVIFLPNSVGSIGKLVEPYWSAYSLFLVKIFSWTTDGLLTIGFYSYIFVAPFFLLNFLRKRFWQEIKMRGFSFLFFSLGLLIPSLFVVLAVSQWRPNFF